MPKGKKWLPRVGRNGVSMVLRKMLRAGHFASFIDGKAQRLSDSRWQALQTQLYNAVGLFFVFFLLLVLSAAFGTFLGASGSDTSKPSPFLVASIKMLEVSSAAIMSVALALMLASLTEFSVAYASVKQAEGILLGLESLLGLKHLDEKKVAVVLASVKFANTRVAESAPAELPSSFEAASQSQGPGDIINHVHANMLHAKLHYAVDFDISAYAHLVSMFVLAGLSPPALVWASALTTAVDGTLSPNLDAVSGYDAVISIGLFNNSLTVSVINGKDSPAALRLVSASPRTETGYILIKVEGLDSKEWTRNTTTWHEDEQGDWAHGLKPGTAEHALVSRSVLVAGSTSTQVVCIGGTGGHGTRELVQMIGSRKWDSILAQSLKCESFAVVIRLVGITAAGTTEIEVTAHRGEQYPNQCEEC